MVPRLYAYILKEHSVRQRTCMYCTRTSTYIIQCGLLPVQKTLVRLFTFTSESLAEFLGGTVKLRGFLFFIQS